jgi:hypothetical protein
MPGSATSASLDELDIWEHSDETTGNILVPGI